MSAFSTRLFTPILALVPVLVTPSLFAQDPGGNAATETKPTPADIELLNRPETDEEKKQRLIEQFRNLKSEVDFLAKIDGGGGLVGKLKERLAHRTVESQAQAIDDPGAPQGAAAQPGDAPDADAGQATEPAQPQVKKARLLGDEEKNALPEGTILTVEGFPVSKTEFEATLAYLKGVPSGRTEDQLMTQALEAVIVRKAVEAAFPDGAKTARDRMVKIQQQLSSGTDFAEVAKTHSDCPSKAQGGDLGMFGRQGMDLHFTIGSFGLKEGEVSKPIQTAFGYHLIKRTGGKKGEDANGDQVRCSHILTMYSADQFKVRQASMNVRHGTVDVAFVSDDYRKAAPSFLR